MHNRMRVGCVRLVFEEDDWLSWSNRLAGSKVVQKFRWQPWSITQGNQKDSITPWKIVPGITKELRCNSGNTPWKRKNASRKLPIFGFLVLPGVLISETWLYFSHMIAKNIAHGSDRSTDLGSVSSLDTNLQTALRFAIPCLFVSKPGVFFS